MKCTTLVKNKMPLDYTHSVICHLNPHNNGGEAVSLTVDFFDNGDGHTLHSDGIFSKLSLTTTCYGISESTISLGQIGLEEFEKAIKLIKEETN